LKPHQSYEKIAKYSDLAENKIGTNKHSVYPTNVKFDQPHISPWNNMNINQEVNYNTFLEMSNRE